MEACLMPTSPLILSAAKDLLDVDSSVECLPPQADKQNDVPGNDCYPLDLSS